jgi:hypothetical protein
VANSVADEPPFFISQNNSSGLFDIVENGLSDGKPFGCYSQQDSEKEDLRDVIDDLTIENKRLKRLLKNRKGQQDSQDCDKLFEVRVHGLPSDKKRELEELLRSFTSNLNVTSGLAPCLLSGPPSGTQKPNVDSRFGGAPTQVRQTDSGYASNSNSGQTSATPSNPGRATTAVSRKSNHKTVKSYLHNIPNGLLPRQPIVMSERAKMSLVVRRLENLFTGKKAAPGEHSQPLQQQEVSRLAANADMQRGTNHHRKEGSREAHILPFDSEVNIERLDSLESSSSDSKSQLPTKSQASGKSTPDGASSASSAARSPDQRPTRPLDLDVHRAQIAEENLEYIRHLGLTSPKLNAEADKEEGEGWVYLNLLISMAQLHTVHVTPAFIKKSIKKLSAKFELSEDGNKVRWKRGGEAQCFRAGNIQKSDMTEEIMGSEIVGLGANNADKQPPNMAASNTLTSATPSEDQSSHRLTSQSSMRVQPLSITPDLHSSIPTSQSQPGSSFGYTPILLTRQSLLRPSLPYLDETSGWQSRFGNSLIADSTDVSDGIADHADAGLIVFYNSTLFCSDFSGDRAPTNMRRSNFETSTCALGVRTTAQLDETREPDVSYFAKSCVKRIPEQAFDELAFDLPPLVDSRNAEHTLHDLPASGIGGVTPQDNFLIDVKIARSPSDEHDGKRVGLGERKNPKFKYRVATCSKTDLPPSQLPPPSYIFLPFTSSGSSVVDEAWDSKDEVADTSADEHELVPPVYLAQFATEDSSPNDGDEEMDSDSSVDMLATARAIDPSRIAAQEREFALTRKPTPMDEEGITGSLAATAGEGSETDSGVESDVDEAGSSTDSDDDF